MLVTVFCTRSGLATENPKIAPSKSFQHRFSKCAKAIQMEEAVFPIFSNKECWRNWLSRPSLRVSHWQKDVWIKSFPMSVHISHLLAYRMGISQWQKEVIGLAWKESLLSGLLRVSILFNSVRFSCQGPLPGSGRVSLIHLSPVAGELGDSISDVFFCWREFLDVVLLYFSFCSRIHNRFLFLMPFRVPHLVVSYNFCVMTLLDQEFGTHQQSIFS